MELSELHKRLEGLETLVSMLIERFSVVEEAVQDAIASESTDEAASEGDGMDVDERPRKRARVSSQP